MKVRIAALADLHCPRGPIAELGRRLRGIEEEADLLLLCGDLTDEGEPHQARVLANELSNVSIPKIGVLGNHDYESENDAEVRRILEDAGVRILDGETCVVGSLGIAGTKGFGGGFGKRRVSAFGEPATKQFVLEGERQAEILEKALCSLQTPKRIAVTHYAPIIGTVTGESPEIVPFLGNSALASAAERGSADAMFHGHSHFGRVEGRTEHGVPVYNCAIPVLDQLRPPRRFMIVPIDV